MPAQVDQDLDLEKDKGSEDVEDNDIENKDVPPKKDQQGAKDKTSEKKDEVLDADTYEPEVRGGKGENYWRDQYFKNLPGSQKKESKKEDEEEGEEGEKPKSAGNVREEVLDIFGKMFGPVLETLQGATIDSEVNAFLSRPENAGLRKYERLVRKDALVYRNVPVAKLFRSHAYDDAVKLGSEREKEAQKGARRNKLGGSSQRRPIEGAAPDFKKMTDKEFQEYQAKIKKGEIVKLEEEE